MKTTCIAAVVSVVLASEDVFDEGLSLLQMRAQHAQEPKYFLKGAGTDCAPEEDIDYAMCLEAQIKQIVPNTIAAWGIIYNQRSGGYMQRGCFMIGGNIYFSDEPVGGRLGRGSARIQPICSKSGGYEAYIAKNEISCKEADCTHKPANEHLLNWGDALVIPELQILDAGAICESCGVLSYAQCAKAADTGILEAITGKRVISEMGSNCQGAGHSRPAMPGGCSVSARHPDQVSFCPYDAPDGVLAGLVSDSGAGVGFSGSRPVCGACTTTTTAAALPEGEDDQAAAIGDPHLATNTGKHFDYSLD